MELQKFGNKLVDLRNSEVLGNLFINLLQVELVFYRSLVKNENYSRKRILSVFLQQDQITIQEDPKGFTWHKHYLKHKKHNHNRSEMTYLLLNRNKKQRTKIKSGCLPTSAVV